jgi:hypothetical protein
LFFTQLSAPLVSLIAPGITVKNGRKYLLLLVIWKWGFPLTIVTGRKLRWRFTIALSCLIARILIVWLWLKLQDSLESFRVKAFDCVEFWCLEVFFSSFDIT